ncbi:MAG: hypothetical protein AAB911_01300 [Patescibacteria group bacterium]
MNNITILTATLYKRTTETRFQLACQLIGKAIAVGYDVVVVDGSIDATVSRALAKVGAKVHRQAGEKGMGNQKRELFSMVANDDNKADIFLWTEPEKADIIRWVPQIIAPIQRGEADLVIPERTPTSYASYPMFQIKSEKQINAVFADTTGKCFDVAFGPVAFRRGLLSYFAECYPAKRFGVSDNYIQDTARLEVMAAGYKIVSVPIDFLYPPAQKTEEETTLFEIMREKRQQQLEELTHTFRVVGKTLKLKQ